MRIAVGLCMGSPQTPTGWITGLVWADSGYGVAATCGVRELASSGPRELAAKGTSFDPGDLHPRFLEFG